MIGENIHGIHKCFDDVPAEERIVAIAGCESMEEKQNAVTVQQLGLGIAKRFD